MKRPVRRILLIVLVVAELWLLTGFLPQRWQDGMYSRLDTVWPWHSYDYSRITHPAFEHELQTFEPFGTVLLAVIAAINGGFIVALWVRAERN
jgi:hypothetical protein